MPVPRLFLLPVPVAVGMFITYEAGFTQDKPEWYRKSIANEYKQVSQPPHTPLPPSSLPAGLPACLPPLCCH